MIALAVMLAVIGEAPTELRAAERPVAVLLVAASKRSEGLPSTASVLHAADVALRRVTGLAIESPERLGITATTLAECPPESLLGCALANATSAPSPPPFVIVVTLLKIGAAPLRAGISVLDVAEGVRRKERAKDSSELEDALAELAWSLRASEVESGGLEVFFGEAGAGMSRFLEDHRVRVPGSIRVDTEVPGKTVLLDGNALGAIGGTRGLIVDARPGRRQVKIEPADGFLAIDLELESGRTSTAAFVRVRERSTDPLRLGFRFGGPVVAIGGATVVAIALSIRGGATSYCLGRGSSDDCDDLGSAHAGFDASDGPTTTREAINPGGLDLVAFGLALVGAGGTLAVGGWLGTFEEAPPWWLGLLALGVGGVLYGAAALVGSP